MAEDDKGNLGRGTSTIPGGPSSGGTQSESGLLTELRGRVEDSAKKNEILRAENLALRTAISKIVSGAQKHSPGNSAATVSVDDLEAASLLLR